MQQVWRVFAEETSIKLCASGMNLFSCTRPYLNEQVLDLEHQRIVETAMAEFDSRKKLGGEEFSLKYRYVLNRWRIVA